MKSKTKLELLNEKTKAQLISLAKSFKINSVKSNMKKSEISEILSVSRKFKKSDI